MDGWGSLTMLMRRQNADKYRKAKLRYELQKRKEDFLTNKAAASEFDFPELSKDEMDHVKDTIRSKMKREKILANITSLLIFVATCLLIVWLILAHTD